MSESKIKRLPHPKKQHSAVTLVSDAQRSIEAVACGFCGDPMFEDIGITSATYSDIAVISTCLTNLEENVASIRLLMNARLHEQGMMLREHSLPVRGNTE